ncbi:MAG: stage II sporulation protein M [Spirochaetaceae bacterium]|jgi:uncharacterized membrane protein SpoIIM required for sporulation|nr:stage II sporulation protein M [Spirochaetaceae bacterium]
MTEQRFLALREESWNQFEILLRLQKKEFQKHAASFPTMLRSLIGDLNAARANGFDPSIIDRLNRLALDGNHILCSARKLSLSPLLEFFTHTLPQSVRLHWRSFCACCFLFYAVAAFAAFLCIYKPSFAAGFLGRKNMANLDDMYNKNSHYYLKPRDVTTDADMFGYYIYNNISITFQTFAGGVFAGIGSIFFLTANALFFGSAVGYIINKGLGETFFSFVSGHSALELTGLVLSSQAGLILGYSLFVTKGVSRSASFRTAGKSAFPLLAGAAVFDFLAAIIEAFWSSKHTIPATIHYIFGAALWILLVCYFLFCGRKNYRSTAAAWPS